MKLRTFFLVSLSVFSLMPVAAQKNYEIGNPKNDDYSYLNDYRPLKEYINYAKYPNFKLGIGTTVNDYLNPNSLVGGLTNDNFTETVAGNAMKMASCVDSNGNMNFSTVKRYVDAATEAGISVYGHTLAWHSQQPTGWLRNMLKDRPAKREDGGDTEVFVPVVTKDFTVNQNVGWTSNKSEFGFTLTFSNTNGLQVHTTKKCTNSWDVQFLAVTDLTLEKGTDYKVTMRVKATSAGSFHTKLGSWSDGATAELPFDTEWKDVEVMYNNAKGGDFYMLQCGDFVGDIYVKSITIAKKELAKEVTEKRRCIVVSATEKKSEVWDNQFWISTGDFAAGAKYEFTAEVRADQSASASTQIHTAPGSYVHYEAIGNVKFTTDWKTISISGTLSKAGSSIAFNLNELAAANNYYFDNLSFKINGEERLKNGDLEGTDVSSFFMKAKGTNGQAVAATISDGISYVYTPSPIPLTPEEKHDTLVYAMDKWIKGMMEACDGKVKAWDVVNEAISGGGDDGQGNYTLQHGNGYTPGDTSWDVGGDAFYWQDFMGDLEYVRQAVRLARKYGPEDIKLFINDYNLESDWDNNKKLKSLINWIKKWEADGETHIDGIGTQMHISYYMDAKTQKSKEDHIVKMFQLMAASGKLVRVSELDMGINDASGKSISTANVTEEQHKRMADFYKWIVEKYLEIIPADQQWGICQWCPTDAPANSGWRGGEPVGFWTLDFYRKHAYAGIAEGLGGVVYNDIDAVGLDQNSGSEAIYDLRGNKISADLDTLPSGFYIVGGRKIMK